MIDIPHPYNTALSKYSYIDLFAGIGGFHIALSSFGAKCEFVSEWDRHAASTYQKNFGCKVHGDVTKIEEKKIPPHDILCAGFPCQAFSISGKQLGFEDTRGTLFFEIARIVDYHHPKLVFLENVANFARHDDGKTLSKIVGILEDLEYTVFHNVLNSSKFGIPQDRSRIYILGFHKSLSVKEYVFPKEYGEIKPLKNILERTVDNSFYLPLKYKPVITEAFSENEFLFPEIKNKPVRIGYVNKGGQGERIYHPSGQAITLSAYGGGVGAKTGLYLVDDEIRKLTPRECCRLMGFPENFIIHENKNQAYQQFGNAVVVDVLQAIIISLIEKNILC